MSYSFSVRAACRYGLILAVVAGSVMLSSGQKQVTSNPHNRAAYADPGMINFVRPGLTITIVSSKIATDGTITVDYKLADPTGQPLDQAGVFTPGVIATSFVAAYVPKGQTQFVSYATRVRASTDGKNSVTQAAADSGGTTTTVSLGEYIYTFKTKAPTNFEATSTHRICIYGSRNLTQWSLPNNYDDAILDFVPAGGTPAPRDVVRTATCNKCHDQLAHHGGSRRSVEVCIACHTPQTTDPNNGAQADFKVMIHKIHMGSQLPSVVGGTPYAIGSSDWSTVVFPSDPRRCESCHDPKNGAAQQDAWLKNPSRAACGSCHDDVNFATGQNHLNLPQIDDSQCAGCHIPKGELEFDASIRGAHTIPQQSTTSPGVVVTIVKVDNGLAGQKPTVTYTLRDSAGNGIPITSMTASPNKVSIVMAGPTTDFGYTSFGSDVTSPGYVSESAAATSKCSSDGTCTYTFTHAIPATAKGTYAVGIEARRGLTLLPGTVQQQSTQYGAINPVSYFSVDGSKVTPRRQVVDIAKCNGCHTQLSMHGDARNQTLYCVFCHNPSNTSSAAPKVAINFPFLIHSIHYGDNMQADGATYKVGNSDFSGVRFPALNLTGTPGDVTNCTLCHVNGSESVFPVGKNAVQTPNLLLNPTPATTAACVACHVTLDALAHAQSQTDPKFGESCTVCHGATADFSISQVHANK